MSVFLTAVTEGESRHARMVSVATGAMSEARAGLYPARAAAETLEALFADAVTTPMPGRAVRTPATARSEWRGILAWAVAQAQVADLQAVRARAAAAVPADTLSFDAGAARSPAYFLPEEFWSARGELERVRRIARARRASPDAVLGVALARIAAAVPPRAMVDTGIGHALSLNEFVVVLGEPTKGKSVAADMARAVVSLPALDLFEVTLGSGQGIPESFMGSTRDEDGHSVRTQVREHVLFYVDEGDGMFRRAARIGEDVLSLIRESYFAHALGGGGNASAERRRIIPAHSYAMGGPGRRVLVAVLGSAGRHLRAAGGRLCAVWWLSQAVSSSAGARARSGRVNMAWYSPR
jgi:hypothetical protein